MALIDYSKAANVEVEPDPILVRDYLRDPEHTYETLLADHGVRAKPYNGKVSFVYDQITARDDDPIARQCRGLILRESDLALIAYPFDRFFNLGQPAASEIDWKTAVFEEKLDGTLIIAYCYENHWYAATRSMCEAHGQINGADITFAQLLDSYCQLWGCDDFHTYMWAHKADTDFTYMFELTGPDNTIVCQYAEPKLTLIGRRCLTNLLEFETGSTEFETVRTYPLADLNTALAYIDTLKPEDHEGIIVRDAAFNRIKVKSPKYLAIAHASDSLANSWRACVELVQSGGVDDVMHLLTPMVQARINTVLRAYLRLESDLEAELTEISGAAGIKTFALAAQKCSWSSPLFAVRRGKSESIAAFLASATADSILDHIDLKG